jgi:hypothetical protein
VRECPLSNRCAQLAIRRLSEKDAVKPPAPGEALELALPAGVRPIGSPRDDGRRVGSARSPLGPDAARAERAGDEGAARGRRGGRGCVRGAVVGEVTGDARADEPARAAARARGHSGRPRRGQAVGVHAHPDRQREPGRSRHPGVGRQPLAPPQGRNPPLRARVDGASRRPRPIAGRGRGSGPGPSLPPQRPAVPPVPTFGRRGARAVRPRRERGHSVADPPRSHARRGLS